jgi:hypothetical protein
MIVSEPPPDPPITLAMDLIRRYAGQRNWIPIGWRAFMVGPWDITVNGTREARDGIPPWHARAVHQDIVAILLFDAFGGSVGGFRDAEEWFIQDLERALFEDGGSDAIE